MQTSSRAALRGEHDHLGHRVPPVVCFLGDVPDAMYATLDVDVALAVFGFQVTRRIGTGRPRDVGAQFVVRLGPWSMTAVSESTKKGMGRDCCEKKQPGYTERRQTQGRGTRLPGRAAWPLASTAVHRIFRETIIRYPPASKAGG